MAIWQGKCSFVCIYVRYNFHIYQLAQKNLFS